MADESFKKYANSFQAIARLRLESIRALLDELGNPQKQLKFIHVAGTNGKGSVCAFLQCILTDAGYRTGKYISPNLISVCERISVDGENIPEDEADAVMERVRAGAEKVREKYGEPPTQFEVWTAAAFCYFLEKQCDVVVLETGLGGTRDATNIIEAPLASVITHIALDHTAYLGDTVEEIARQKAGIIKEPYAPPFAVVPSGNDTENTRDGGNTVNAAVKEPYAPPFAVVPDKNNGKGIICVGGLTVSVVQEPSAANVIEKTCREKKNRLVWAKAPCSAGTKGCREFFDYGDMHGIICGIPGLHQLENAALAIETAMALKIPERYIRSGIERASNPARFEIISEKPMVVYDGAHNRNGMNALAKCLVRYFKPWNGAVFITAFMQDKDIDGVFDELRSFGLNEGAEVYAVKVKNNPRAAETADVCSIAEKHGFSAETFESIKKAYDCAAGKGKLVVICGSLYLYKDFTEEVLQDNEKKRPSGR